MNRRHLRRHLIRHSLMLAAISGAQLTFAQAPQAGNNPTVVEELNKLFKENGQEMPSMKASDLPNANVHRVTPTAQTTMPPQTTMSPAQQSNGQPSGGQSVTGQSSAAASTGRPAGQQWHGKTPQTSTNSPARQTKKNPFQKMLGRIRGSGSEAPTTQPQPAAGGQTGLSTLSAPPPTMAPQHTPAAGRMTTPANGTAPRVASGNPGTAVPGIPDGRRTQQRPAQGNSQAAVKPQGSPGGTAPAVNSSGMMFHNGARGQTASTAADSSKSANGGAPTGGNVPAVPGRPRGFVQPGTAPAFLPSGGTDTLRTAQRPSTGVPGIPSASQIDRFAPIQPAPVAPPSDDFVDPFSEPEESVDEAVEDLDLDSLIEIPKANGQPVPAPREIGSESRSGEAPVAGAGSLNQTAIPSDRDSDDSVTDSGSNGTPNAIPDQENAGDMNEDSPDSDPVSPQNPFTGVRINGLPDDAELEINDNLLKAEQPADAEDDGQSGDQTLPSGEFAVPAPRAQETAAEDDFIGNEAPSSSNAVGNSVSVPQEPTSPAAAVAGSPVTIAPARTPETAVGSGTPEEEHRKSQQKLVAARSGQPGFRGFCPVQLRDQRDLVDADATITAQFGLQTYSFSTLAAKTAFEADPSRYAPAAGGSDVVLLVNSGEEQPGSLEYCLWYRDRLYMFRSKETMAQFARDPARFGSQY